MKHLQAAILLSTLRHVHRRSRIGAVGLRADGVVVTGKSGGAKDQWSPGTHAEARLSRKLTPGSVVYVARTLMNGNVAMAKPCQSCQNCLRHRGVVRVYYTIGNNEFGVLNL